MVKTDLERFKCWFDGYTKSFHSDDREDLMNIRLKETHTLEVCKNMSAIAAGVFAYDNDLLIAEASALFHDVGRFPQYARFKTFKDSQSVNHAFLGAQVLSESGVFNGIDLGERELILQAVKYHNAFVLPRLESTTAQELLKLVRDADKLDIWRVFIEYFNSPMSQRPSAAALGYPDNGRYSDGIIDTIMNKRPVNLKDAKTLTDYKLLQLSWIFDLNYPQSFGLLLKRRYIESMMATMPQTGEIIKLGTFLTGYAGGMSLERRREVMSGAERRFG